MTPSRVEAKRHGKVFDFKQLEIGKRFAITM
jgi:hypothetical protein